MRKLQIASLLCALIVLLCGCGSVPAETAPQTTAAAAPAPNPLILVTDGVPQAKVIRPERAKNAVIKAAAAFRKDLSDATGATFEIGEDWFAPDTADYADALEILVGDCNRDESRTFLDTLKAGEYGYCVAGGKKLVIGGATPELTERAIALFLEDVTGFAADDGNVALPGDAREGRLAEDLVDADGNHISLSSLKIDCLGASNTVKTVDTQKKSDTSVNYTTMLRDLLGCEMRKFGDSGANSAKASGRTDSYVERMVKMDKDADIVILQGEGNDATHKLPLGKPGDTDPTTFCGAIRTVILYVEENMPDAKLIILSGMSKKNQPSRTAGLKHEDFHRAFMEVCTSCGYAPYDFTLDEVIQPKDTGMMPDGLHMSKTACERYAGIVADLVKEAVKK